VVGYRLRVGWGQRRGASARPTPIAVRT